MSDKISNILATYSGFDYDHYNHEIIAKTYCPSCHGDNYEYVSLKNELRPEDYYEFEKYYYGYDLDNEQYEE